jgi:pimeloyl-ACP methyl ester carboxylesterase
MSISFSVHEKVSGETAVVFGEYSHLIGICTRPERSTRADVNDASQGFAVVMVTAGMLPSSGPFRLHMSLAQSLSAEGIASLRFDLSGIGESLAVGGGGSSLERAAKEISAAIDYLHEELGIERVALFGLCSGADDALYAALQDHRIMGVFSIDGCGYRTRGYYWHRLLRNYLPKLTSIRAWQDRILRFTGDHHLVPESLQLANDIREFPDRETAAGQLMQLVQRGVALHFHYTGGVGDYYNHARQFKDMFADTALARSGLIKKISTSFTPETDHVAFLTEHREELVNYATTCFISMSYQAGLAREKKLESAEAMVQTDLHERCASVVNTKRNGRKQKKKKRSRPRR